MQKDSADIFIKSVEHLDSAKRKIEIISYYPNGEISSVTKMYYDSLGKQSLSTHTSFSKNKSPATQNRWFFYDNNGLMTKEVFVPSWDYKDTVTTFYFFDTSRKLIKEKKTAAKENSIWWEGVKHYFYNKDKIIKTVVYDLNETLTGSYDSIAYTDTTQTLFEFNSETKLHSKTITFYYKNKPVKVLEYYKEAFSDSLYLNSKIEYGYNTVDSIIKKERVVYERTEWCGMTSSEQHQKFTYEYNIQTSDTKY